jgi:hypothetical protein
MNWLLHDPLSRKRTFGSVAAMSAFDPKRTLRASKFQRVPLRIACGFAGVSFGAGGDRANVSHVFQPLTRREASNSQ